MLKLFINLDSSLDRRINFETNHTGFSRVQAIEPATMPAGIHKFHPYMSDTEVSCFLSHLSCWKTIAESQSDYALVCEDDVLVQFEPNYFINPQADFIHINNVLSVANQDTDCSWEELNRKSSSCYIISKQLCGELVERFKENSTAYIADLFSDYMPNARVVSVNTNLFSYSPYSQQSTIELGLLTEIKRMLRDSVTNLNIVE